MRGEEDWISEYACTVFAFTAKGKEMSGRA